MKKVLSILVSTFERWEILWKTEFVLNYLVFPSKPEYSVKAVHPARDVV